MSIGLLLLLGVYGLVRWSASALGPSGVTAEKARAAPSTDAERLAALEHQVKALQVASLLSSARAHVESPQAAAEPVPTTTPTQEQPPTTPEEERAQEEERRRVEKAARQELLQSFSDRVDTEVLDPRWRGVTEERISAVFPRELGPEIELGEVKCASTICRASLSHPNQGRISPATWMQFAHNRGELGNMEMHLDHSKGGTTTLYLLRRDEEAPSGATED